MISYDSKLIFGCRLGKISEILPRLEELFDDPPHPPADVISNVEWINTLLPNGISLDITYPFYGGPIEETFVHINMIDDEPISIKKMKKCMKHANIGEYGYLLGQVGLDYVDPTFYTVYYRY